MKTFGLLFFKIKPVTLHPIAIPIAAMAKTIPEFVLSIESVLVQCNITFICNNPPTNHNSDAPKIAEFKLAKLRVNL